jgi:hypothetical protein
LSGPDLLHGANPRHAFDRAYDEDRRLLALSEPDEKENEREKDANRPNRGQMFHDELVDRRQDCEKRAQHDQQASPSV